MTLYTYEISFYGFQERKHFLAKIIIIHFYKMRSYTFNKF